MTAQWFGTPVLSGTAFIAVKEMDVARELVLPVSGPGIDLYRQLMEVDRAAVHANVVLLHQKDLAGCACILLFRDDLFQRRAHIQTRMIGDLALAAPFFPVDDQRVRVLLIDVIRQSL